MRGRALPGWRDLRRIPIQPSYWRAGDGPSMYRSSQSAESRPVYRHVQSTIKGCRHSVGCSSRGGYAVARLRGRRISGCAGDRLRRERRDFGPGVSSEQGGRRPVDLRCRRRQWLHQLWRIGKEHLPRRHPIESHEQSLGRATHRLLLLPIRVTNRRVTPECCRVGRVAMNKKRIRRRERVPRFVMWPRSCIAHSWRPTEA